MSHGQHYEGALTMAHRVRLNPTSRASAAQDFEDIPPPESSDEEFEEDPLSPSAPGAPAKAGCP